MPLHSGLTLHEILRLNEEEKEQGRYEKKREADQQGQAADD